MRLEISKNRKDYYRKMKQTIWIFASILMICFTILLSYLYISKIYRVLNQMLDTFLTHNTITEFSGVLETRESKLYSRLMQFLVMTKQQKIQEEEEKKKITAFISDLSHQLKTPLSNILIYIELLKDENLSKEEIQEFLEKTEKQTEKIQWLIKNLFKISRLETGIIEFETNPTFIKKTIADAISNVYTHSLKKNITIICNHFTDEKLIHNPKWTSEAITNILENAIKYSKENTTITISLIPMELYSIIKITDEGIGIDEKEYNNIFKRFYRGEQVEEKEGSGLGLYLAQLILQKEGGYIVVHSKIGYGSTFSLYLQRDIKNTFFLKK